VARSPRIEAPCCSPTDRPIRLTERFAACFADTRSAGLVEHQVESMVMQRIVGIALGYEDLNDHDELRRDPVLAVLATKLEAQRSDCAPPAVAKANAPCRQARTC
jgi:hypothetical protein